VILLLHVNVHVSLSVEDKSNNIKDNLYEK
jgi:hypothetical protein